MPSRQRRRISVGAIGAAVILLTAGCGSSTDTGTPATSTSIGSTTSTPTSTAPSDDQTGQVAVRLFFTPGSGGADCSETTAVGRTVQGPGVLAATLKALLAGPTAGEKGAGLQSWFSDATADSLMSVKIVDGTAHIDFKNFSTLISGASSSCGSSQLMSQLDRTARQFPTVQRTLYSFDGDVEAFYAWLQGSPPDYYQPGTTAGG